MSSEEMTCSSSDPESEHSNYHQDSVHFPYTNSTSINPISNNIETDDENLPKENPLTSRSGSPKKNSSIPDVSRVIGCINRVLNLSKYAPPNTTPFGLPLKNDIIAVIPAYNEELTIGMVVLLSLQHVGRVIVVDDGSKDRTAQIAWLSGADVVQLEHNQGKATAVKAGFARARENGCSALVMLDADGQHNPSEIPDILEPVLSGNADLVIGSRHLTGDHDNTPSYRRLGQRTLDMATNMGNTFKSTDTQSGFRAFSKKAVEIFTFPSEGYNIESDMIEHYSRLGYPIIEVPITARYEVPFKHKKNPFSHGADILAHIVGVIGYRRPLLTFGLSGFICLLIGIFFGYFAFDQYYSTGKFVFIFTMFSGISLVLGLLLITTGLILNSLVKIVKMG